MSLTVLGIPKGAGCMGLTHRDYPIGPPDARCCCVRYFLHYRARISLVEEPLASTDRRLFVDVGALNIRATGPAFGLEKRNPITKP